MPRKIRYLIEFDQPEGREKLESMLMVGMNCTKVIRTDGMPGHPPYALIVHGTTRQMHDIEKMLSLGFFDNYRVNCNRI